MEEVGGIGSRLTFGGLATGLDTGALIDALLDAERRPLRLLQARRDTLNDQKSALQTLGSSLLALRDAARAIDNRSTGLDSPSAVEEFLAFQGSSSDESILEVDVAAGASPGSFQVRVEALAGSARRVSEAFSAPDTSITNNPRNFRIDYGDGQQISFQVARNSTLQDLRDQIEQHVDNDGTIRADILFDGSGHRLVISGTETGAANDVVVSTNLRGPSGGSFLDAAAGADASDARLHYLGVTVTRPTNDVTDLVPGVTLRLRGINDPANPNDAVSVDVFRDDEAIAEKLQAFVDAYNEVRRFSLDQTAIDPETNRGGILIGDPLVRQVEFDVQTAIGSVYAFTDNPFATFGQIGVSFDSDGLLSLDQEKLRAALDQDSAAVRQMLSGDGVSDGAATALARSLEPIVQPGEGFIAIREDGFDDRIETLERQIERFEERLASREETLIRQFSALESLVASLQGQASFLSGFVQSQLASGSGRS